MQHTPPGRPQDQRPIVIEVEGEPLGVAVPLAEGFRFLAVKLPVFAIDGRTYSSIEAATAAATIAARDAA
jgi:uncharacterized protein (DUF934 family)